MAHLWALCGCSAPRNDSCIYEPQRYQVTPPLPIAPKWIFIALSRGVWQPPYHLSDSEHHGMLLVMAGAFEPLCTGDPILNSKSRV